MPASEVPPEQWPCGLRQGGEEPEAAAEKLLQAWSHHRDEVRTAVQAEALELRGDREVQVVEKVQSAVGTGQALDEAIASELLGVRVGTALERRAELSQQERGALAKRVLASRGGDGTAEAKVEAAVAAWAEEKAQTAPYGAAKMTAASRTLALYKAALCQCHLMQLLPPRCLPPMQRQRRRPHKFGLVVGGKRVARPWSNGSMIVFDDVFLHSVRVNPRLRGERVVLIVDLWHPGADTALRDEIRAGRLLVPRTSVDGRGAAAPPMLVVEQPRHTP